MMKEEKILNRRMPVIVAVYDCTSGVVSWAKRLREAFRGNLKYEVLLLPCCTDYARNSSYDLYVDSWESAHETLAKLSPAIVVPNFVISLYPICAELVESGKDMRCVGFCRSDSEEEYYNPLTWYESIISSFVAVSPECARNLSEKIPHRTKDIDTLPTGVFVPEILNRRYQASPIRIVYGGRIAQVQKRVMDFVPLVENLLQLRVDFVFDLIGEGSHVRQLRAAMDEIPHGGRVRIHSKVSPSEMDGIWSDHDIFVQVSEYEGTSNSMLESMASGTVPIVTAASSGVKGVVVHGGNGFVVPVGDMHSMAIFIHHLSLNPGEIELLGTAAHEMAKQYSMESYVKKFTAILDGTLITPSRTWPHERDLEPELKMIGLKFSRIEQAKVYCTGAFSLGMESEKAT